MNRSISKRNTWSAVINSAESVISQRAKKRPLGLVIVRSVQLLQSGDREARLQGVKQWVSGEAVEKMALNHLFEKLISEKMVSHPSVAVEKLENYCNFTLKEKIPETPKKSHLIKLCNC